MGIKPQKQEHCQSNAIQRSGENTSSVIQEPPLAMKIFYNSDT